MVLSFPVASTENDVGSEPRIFSIFGLTPLRYSKLRKDFVIVSALYRLGSVSVNREMIDEDMKLINSNGKIVYKSDLIVFHYRRSNFLKHFRNIYIDQDVTSSTKDFLNLVNNRYEEYRYDIQRPILPPNKLFASQEEIFYKS